MVEKRHTGISVRRGWDAISGAYQAENRISTDDVHYGALSPGERSLKLLGDVPGRSVLELGCGGGQNTIALAKWGAKAAGLDLSPKQIAFAKRLAQKEGVSATFYAGSMEDLRMFGDSSHDVVLTSFATAYVRDIDRVFMEVHRVLRDNGVFVLADLHPLASRGRSIKLRDRRAWLVEDYFRRGTMVWSWPRFSDGTTARFYSFHRTLQDYFDAFARAQFQVERVLEPKPLSIMGTGAGISKAAPCYAPSVAKDLELWQRIPYTIIFKARKEGP